MDTSNHFKPDQDCLNNLPRPTNCTKIGNCIAAGLRTNFASDIGYRKRKYNHASKQSPPPNGSMDETNAISDNDLSDEDDCRVSLTSADGNSLSNDELRRNRQHHNELERKRRDHIKVHFNMLKNEIPLLEGEKSSRALILKRAADYIKVLQLQLKEAKQEIEKIKRRNDVLSHATSLLSSSHQTHSSQQAVGEPKATDPTGDGFALLLLPPPPRPSLQLNALLPQTFIHPSTSATTSPTTSVGSSPTFSPTIGGAPQPPLFLLPVGSDTISRESANFAVIPSVDGIRYEGTLSKDLNAGNSPNVAELLSLLISQQQQRLFAEKQRKVQELYYSTTDLNNREQIAVSQQQQQPQQQLHQQQQQQLQSLPFLNVLTTVSPFCSKNNGIIPTQSTILSSTISPGVTVDWAQRKLSQITTPISKLAL